MTVEGIKEAIDHLPDEERTALAAWIVEQDMAAWDRQIEKDFSPGGTGAALLEQVKADIRAGKFKPLAQPLITCDPKIMMGKPTVAGTRITVELILEKLAAGESPDQILSEHPRLTSEGLRAAIAFAAEALRADVLYPVEKVAG